MCAPHESGDTSSTPADIGGTMSEASQDQEIDEPIFMKESVKLGPIYLKKGVCVARMSPAGSPS